MNDTEQTTGLTIGDYLRPVWRFKWLVVAMVLIAAVAVYLISDAKSRTYQTSAQLYVGQSPIDEVLTSGGTGGGDSTRALANQARLVTAPQVARLVARRLGLPVSPNQLLSLVTVSPATDADFLTISAQASDPQLAAGLVNTFAAAYLDLRRQDTRTGAQAELRTARRQLEGLTGIGNLEARANLRSRISDLQNAALSPPSAGELLSRAQAPNVAISPRPTRNAIFAAILALMLGVVVAYLLDRSDNRLRKIEDVEGLFDLPVLASVPHVRRPLPKEGSDSDVADGLREPSRAMRVNLDLLRSRTGIRVVLITSALPGEGKSTVVRNLALAYEDAGLRAAVVDADLRRPSLAGALGLLPSPGLAEALEDGDEVELQSVRRFGSGHEGVLDVLVSGRPPENPTALLTADRLRPVLARLASQYDVVLIDSPPLLAVSDALPLLSLVDGVALVARAGQLTQTAADRLKRTLARVQGVHLLGTIANDVSDGLAYEYGAASGRVEKPRPSGDVDRSPAPAS